ncbi:hypothetical protein [Sporosarcina sp. Te-1]|uniref:hypothetical protein n=1 Tax=Sporosarcina sp. Te-1 TaxID=2818390 RepID=UPI001A9EB940|nr:hypothetical protein [Sporosarcina sp. Te-1]QTD41780.1 hypothetical protein J3U78_02695 [Sporosarcina sp. Te-1]
MKKPIGLFLVLVSLLLSVGALLEISSDFNAAILGILFFGLPLYTIGQLIRTGTDKFKKYGIRYIWAFIYSLVIVPALFLSIEGYEDLKRKTFADQHFITYEPFSDATGTGQSIAFVMVLLLLFTFPFMELSKRGKWIAGCSTVLVATGFVYYQYIMWNDYRGIHAEHGLLSHSYKGDAETIPYDDIAEITVFPYIKNASLSDPSDDTYFVWKMVFSTKAKQETTYTFYLNQEDIEIGNRIREVAIEHYIPFYFYPMNEKTKEEFIFQLELNKLEKAPFYSFFGVHP